MSLADNNNNLRFESLMASAKYLAFRFKTSKFYLLFEAIQLILCLATLLYSLFKMTFLHNTLAFILEICILILFMFDICIRYLCASDHFFNRKINIVDLTLFCLYSLILVAIKMWPLNRNEFTILKSDNLLLLAILISRYLTQIIRTIFEIRDAHMNLQMQNDMKLEEVNGNLNESAGVNKSMHSDRVFRQKMDKYQNFEEEKGVEEIKDQFTDAL